MKIIKTIPAENIYFKEEQVEVGNERVGIERTVVNLFDEVEYQQMQGFGGAFTESSAYIYSLLSPAQKAEFLEKYCHKGTKLVTEGRIQTGSYTNKDGQRAYTTDVVIENVEFAESKSSSGETKQQAKTDADGFMNIPEGLEEELPFN